MTTTLDPKSLEIKQTIEGAFFATDSSGSRTFVYDITRGHHNLDTGYYVWLSHSISDIRIDEHELRFINKRLSKIGLACNEISLPPQSQQDRCSPRSYFMVSFFSVCCAVTIRMPLPYTLGLNVY
jgi:hypothetical protein